MRSLVDRLPGWIREGDEDKRKKCRRKRKHAKAGDDVAEDGGNVPEGEKKRKRRRVHGDDAGKNRKK